MKAFNPSFLLSQYKEYKEYEVLDKSKSWLIDLFALFIIASIIIFFSWGASSFQVPSIDIAYQHINLDPYSIANYALHTTFRMFVAIVASVIFSIIYASLAAKNKRLEEILIPFLDVLQSVPILGYISFTVTAFIALAPNTMLGLEMAAIFAIFTSQVWNLTFSIYQSLKSVPLELEDAAVAFKLNGWQRFWRVEIPFCIPNMIWNMNISMAGGWFFVVAAETISMGTHNVTLPGIGSGIALALLEENWNALYLLVFAMCSIIFIYNFIIFNPLIIWSDKFKYEMTKSNVQHSNIVLDVFRGSKIINIMCKGLGRVADFLIDLPIMKSDSQLVRVYIKPNVSAYKWKAIIWYCVLSVLFIYCAWYIFDYLNRFINFTDLKLVLYLVSMTFVRVISLILLLSLILIPVGVYIGLRPGLVTYIQPVIQFLASFPANLFFPLVVIYITRYHLDPNIWLSPLMVVGTQWYILFNVISGASQIPTEMREVYGLFQIKGLVWWRKIAIPAILPSYVTGAITASGGAWNASIIAEAVTWGDQHLYATGIGSYITRMTVNGDFPHIALGIIAMSILVVLFNKLFWQPLYNYTTRKYGY